MPDIVKVKALSSFGDTSLGPIVKDGFYKVSRAKADHYIENGLAEEIVVQNKMRTATVTETKPAKIVTTPTKAVTGKSNGNTANRKPTASKKPAAPKRKR